MMTRFRKFLVLFAAVLFLALIPLIGVISQDFRPEAGGTLNVDLLPTGGFEPSEAIGTLNVYDSYSNVRGARPKIQRVVKQNVYGRTLSDDFYYHRNTLNDDEKILYDQIYANAMELNREFRVQSPVPRNRFVDIIRAVRYDNPDLFWLQGNMRYSYGFDDNVTDIILTFNDAAKNLEQYKKRFNDAANSVLQEAMNLPNDTEKIKFIHDWLTFFITYQKSAPLNQTAYSSIVNGRTVCTGYSMAFTFFMQRLGIRSMIVTGRARGGLHAWNLVRIGDEYYEMDVTWDDPLGNPPNKFYYDYFNITTSQIRRTHAREAEASRIYPTAVSTEHSYKTFFGDNKPGSNFICRVLLLFLHQGNHHRKNTYLSK